MQKLEIQTFREYSGKSKSHRGWYHSDRKQFSKVPEASSLISVSQRTNQLAWCWLSKLIMLLCFLYNTLYLYWHSGIALVRNFTKMVEWVGKYHNEKFIVRLVSYTRVWLCMVEGLTKTGVGRLATACSLSLVLETLKATATILDTCCSKEA